MKPVKLKMPSESLSDGILFGLENAYAVISPKERIQKTKATGIYRKWQKPDEPDSRLRGNDELEVTRNLKKQNPTQQTGFSFARK